MSTSQSVAGLPVIVRISSRGMQGAPGTPGAAGCQTFATKAAAIAATEVVPPATVAVLVGPALVFVANDETLNYTPTLYHFDGTTFRQVSNWPA